MTNHISSFVPNTSGRAGLLRIVLFLNKSLWGWQRMRLASLHKILSTKSFIVTQRASGVPLILLKIINPSLFGPACSSDKIMGTLGKFGYSDVILGSH